MDKITLREGIYNEPNTELYKIPPTTEVLNKTGDGCSFGNNPLVL